MPSETTTLRRLHEAFCLQVNQVLQQQAVIEELEARLAALTVVVTAVSTQGDARELTHLLKVSEEHARKLNWHPEALALMHELRSELEHLDGAAEVEPDRQHSCGCGKAMEALAGQGGATPGGATSEAAARAASSSVAILEC